MIANIKELVSIEELLQKQKTKTNTTQTSLLKFYKNTELTEQRVNEINRYLLIAFVCCNISFLLLKIYFLLKHLNI